MTELKTDVAIAKIGKATIQIKDLESNYTHVITRELDEDNKEVYSLESFYKGEKEKKNDPETNPVIEPKKETKEERQARLDKEWLGE